jgi:phosphohistidine swiveling domain-containing protein
MAESDEHLFRTTIDKFSHGMASSVHIHKGLDELRELIKHSAKESIGANIAPLLLLLKKTSGENARLIFTFLKDVADQCTDPSPILRAMLSARDKSLINDALDVALTLAQNGNLEVNYGLIEFLAENLYSQGSYPKKPGVTKKIIDLVDANYFTTKEDSTTIFLDLYQNDKNQSIRLFAAWLLDSSNTALNENIVQTLLGEEMYDFFRPYLTYTRATYSNLLNLQLEHHSLESLSQEFLEAEGVLGKKMLLEVIAKLGWDRINHGIKAEALTGVSIQGSPPFMLSDTEANYALKCNGAKRENNLFKVTACGGNVRNSENQNKNEKIKRFRDYNLNHAALLGYFLDITPLTPERVEDIIRRLNKIVIDYAYLFEAFSDECRILPDVYSKIKDHVSKELEKQNDSSPLSADLMRTVLSFEEPHSLGDVSTLHGLKRYLHQQGLSMGFKLVEGGQSPNRTVDLLLLRDSGIQYSFNKIQFSNFESAEEYQPYHRNIPYSVGVVIEAFFHHMVYGMEKFPKVNIFCYGNEVHYYLGFRNHPAFLRIDYAPPLQGGMIDLEYFGVSNYNLNDHPNPTLDAIQVFFDYMSFDVKLNATRIHARYDKERALNLGDLCEKANQIFHLAPYFMDLDWIIGSLDLDQLAKEKVAKAWATYFIRWGYIPTARILSDDRLGIVAGNIEEPTSVREVLWDGKGDYRDIYTGRPPASFYSELQDVIKANGISIVTPEVSKIDFSPGQLNIKAWIIDPLREALRRGELIETESGLKAESSELFSRINETEHFANLLIPNSKDLISSIGIAGYVQQLEKILSFNTAGSINGHFVQNAILVLRGDPIKIFVLRSGDNMIRLAFYVHGHVLYKTCKTTTGKCECNAKYDTSEFAGLLRDNNFVDSAYVPNNTNHAKEYSQLLKSIKQSTLPQDRAPLKKERIIRGLKASPGFAVGRVVFSTNKREPEDFLGAILVTASLKPEDTSSLRFTDGIISTGGGILSHAGLIAMQLHKPAVIISGKWRRDPSENKVFIYNSFKYQIENVKIGDFNVAIRTDVQKKRYTLREGDLVIIDAFAGSVRALGQKRAVLTIHEGFKLYRTVNNMLAVTENAASILNLRGKRLRAIHQITKVLEKCKEPTTGRYTIFEIFLNEQSKNKAIAQSDKSIILNILLNNQKLSDDTRNYLNQVVNRLANRLVRSTMAANKYLPKSNNFYEIISSRLTIKHHAQAIESTINLLKSSNISLPGVQKTNFESIESLVYDRVANLLLEISKETRKLFNDNKRNPRIRHLIRQVDYVNKLIPPIQEDYLFGSEVQEINLNDEAQRSKYAKKLVIEDSACGFELSDYIGWKAANLAEINHLISYKVVPSWFAVTDYAFKRTLQTPVIGTNLKKHEKITLEQAIERILEDNNITDEQKSLRIQNLWDGVILDKRFVSQVVNAYNHLFNSEKESDENDNIESFVAVRSSSVSEDTETASHAGEFDSFLYINGTDQLLSYLKRTWSSLWTERAIYNRHLSGKKHHTIGGGVIIQRMIDSRVSGVLQTVNIPGSNNREIVINAGLGLGEGIVSGSVAADNITVSKDINVETENLHFNYITGDKKEQVLFNSSTKIGTIRQQTLYHQRLRPALEYFELCELVKIAVSLEKAYGYPLDIEFGIENSKLWILQVRPVTIFQSVLKETTKHYPLDLNLK